MSNKLNKYTNLLYEIKPELFNEWNFEKNNKLDFHKITKGMSIKVWWKCPLCKSDYECSINNKFRGKSCSYCSGRKVNETNNLQKTNPEIAKSWDYGKNKINPNQITKGSNVKFWWICEICDSSYECSVANRTYGFKCSFCSGQKVNHTNSLLSLNPELAKEWHPNKNGDLTPDKVTHKSNKKVWWLGKCGHEWGAKVVHRSNNVNCPYCNGKKVLQGFNDMWTTYPELADKLIQPEMGYLVTKSSSKILSWKCDYCESIVNMSCDKANLKFIITCKECSNKTSLGECVMLNILHNSGIKFEIEKKFKWSQGRIYDFYIPNYEIIIEINGGQHYKNGFSSVGGRTHQQEYNNDLFKKELADNNNILHYFLIDCSKSDFVFILNNIKNSELSNMLDLNFDTKNYKLTNKVNIIMKEVIDVWNKGILDVEEISEKLSLNYQTITKYLKIGYNIGTCDYSDNYRKYIRESKLNYPILVTDLVNNTSVIYKSISEFNKLIDSNSRGSILACCNGKLNKFRNYHIEFI